MPLKALVGSKKRQGSKTEVLRQLPESLEVIVLYIITLTSLMTADASWLEPGHMAHSLLSASMLFPSSFFLLQKITESGISGPSRKESL